MEVDALTFEINALSKEEREQHVRNSLCFICHKMGHISKECLTGSIKEDPVQGRTKGSTRRKARDLEKDIIFEPLIWMTNLKKKKLSRSLINLKKND